MTVPHFPPKLFAPPPAAREQGTQVISGCHDRVVRSWDGSSMYEKPFWSKEGKSGDVACLFYFNEVSSSILVVSDRTELPPISIGLW